MVRKIKNLYHLVFAVLAVILYRFPAKTLTVIGVTGTDGKTTTVNLIYRLLSAAGKKVAIISTTGAEINGKKIFETLHTTTPSPFTIQKFLRQAVDDGCTHLILEVSSHAIHQHRIFGCRIKTAVLTNITHEHLDYHGSMENYLAVKAGFLKKAKIRIINRDDDSFNEVFKKLNGRVITYGITKPADYRAEKIAMAGGKTVFDITGSFPIKNIQTSLLGNFNVENILAAIAAVEIEGVDEREIKKALADFKPPPGRMGLVDAGQNFMVIVDFALTPGAFEKVLPAIKSFTKGKLIHIFGAAGERDQTKRPILGEISSRFADVIILTRDDDHREPVEKIINMIEEGIKKNGWQKNETTNMPKAIQNRTYFVIPDRREAIEFAVKSAEEGDTVFLSGMGHQITMNVNGEETPWSDKEEVERAIKTWIKKK
ncbi:MAG: UDP-N-acetylmuramoyl-L-alanyl-D-glutamate--2,6-diaminopimelate ligase [bacterium]|nr:UDP-N-acetylmuramoyl-L-alanyl-D-glutamate--2,6-diaminopimelate ligase [bacterium]